MKLSICVITMNRAKQLEEALESCLSCELPESTEFIIIDNASNDDTEDVVRATLEDCGYAYYYEKLEENLGVGGGRNYAYEKSNGSYVYMLDDDAVIDTEHHPDFFIRSLDIMESNPDVVTLTTQIYDTAWERERVETRGPLVSEGLYKCFIFCGGSHFLRHSFYTQPPYLPNKYGYEEIPPSLRAMDAGKYNAFCPSLMIVHKPAVNKWDYDDEKNHALLVKGIALPYAIKSMMYPKVVLPFLKLATKRRMKKYLQNVKDGETKVKEAARRFCEEYPIKGKISFGTVCRMFRDFRLSIF